MKTINRKPELMSTKRTEKGDYIQDEFAWRALLDKYHEDDRPAFILDTLIAATETAIQKLEQ